MRPGRAAGRARGPAAVTRRGRGGTPITSPMPHHILSPRSHPLAPHHIPHRPRHGGRASPSPSPIIPSHPPSHITFPTNPIAFIAPSRVPLRPSSPPAGAARRRPVLARGDGHGRMMVVVGSSAAANTTLSANRTQRRTAQCPQPRLLARPEPSS